MLIQGAEESRKIAFAPEGTDLIIFAENRTRVQGHKLPLEYTQRIWICSTPKGVVLLRDILPEFIYNEEQDQTIRAPSQNYIDEPKVAKAELGRSGIDDMLNLLADRQLTEYPDGTQVANPRPQLYPNIQRFIGALKTRRTLTEKPTK